jgi:hypothetical protein
VKTQIATSVLHGMIVNGGLYIPPDIIQGRHIFLAIDNVDFAEDTAYGKRTLHATSMAIYQKVQSADKAPDIDLDDPSQTRSIKDLHHTVTELLDCPKQAAKLPCKECVHLSKK